MEWKEVRDIEKGEEYLEKEFKLQKGTGILPILSISLGFDLIFVNQV